MGFTTSHQMIHPIIQMMTKVIINPHMTELQLVHCMKASKIANPPTTPVALALMSLAIQRLMGFILLRSGYAAIATKSRSSGSTERTRGYSPKVDS